MRAAGAQTRRKEAAVVCTSNRLPRIRRPPLVSADLVNAPGDRAFGAVRVFAHDAVLQPVTRVLHSDGLQIEELEIVRGGARSTR